MIHDCENPSCSRCNPEIDDPEVILDTDCAFTEEDEIAAELFDEVRGSGVENPDGTILTVARPYAPRERSTQ